MQKYKISQEYDHRHLFTFDFQLFLITDMTLSSYIMLKLTGRLSTEKARLFTTQFAFPDSIDSESMVRNIVNYTFLFELAGFVLLCPYFFLTGVEQPVWPALFHSASAFCTAGFSVYTDNLMQFQTNVYVNIVIMVLSISERWGLPADPDYYHVYRSLSFRYRRRS